VLDAPARAVAVLIATTGHMVTGYVDTYFDREVEPEDCMLGDDEDRSSRSRMMSRTTPGAALPYARLRQINRPWPGASAHAIEAGTGLRGRTASKRSCRGRRAGVSGRTTGGCRRHSCGRVDFLVLRAASLSVADANEE
jgi:hypothetical protein